VVRPLSSPAAVVGELASCGAEVLAVVADAERRAALAGDGVVLADAVALEAEPDLAARFEHVVFVDPPQFAHVEALAVQGDGYAHLAWGEAERRFALAMLDEQLARRPAVAALFRDLREAGEANGAELLAALRGGGRHPRGPEAAARGLRVLSELELVRGSPAGGGGSVGVVSSEGTDLERSAAFRAYGDRHQEGVRFLERPENP
jgi:single-stranded-DNA-specific exonuclease